MVISNIILITLNQECDMSEDKKAMIFFAIFMIIIGTIMFLMVDL